jgi:carboxylesterase type B
MLTPQSQRGADIVRNLPIFFILTVMTGTCVFPAIKQPVRVEGGLVSGVPGSDPGVLVFKGIPFAAPPVGNLRWREPKAVVPWQGVRRAEKFSAGCIQKVVPERKPWTYEFMTHGEISEDCLYLNVWTSANSAIERRPVFVYIYGGGFAEGSAQVPVYDGEGLAKKGLVVVTFNYRLGVLGFLAHPGLAAESTHHVSGNYGLTDQLAALRWVHENIAEFGGDPSRVTIAGQSAGGMSVHDLTAAPMAKGLFQRAIVESGGSSVGKSGMRMGPVTMAEAEAQGQKFAEAKAATSAAELRALSWEKLMEPLPSDASGGGAPRLSFAPIPDGYYLPAPPLEVISQGKQNDVVTLTGANRDELGGFGPPQGPVTVESFAKQARQRYGTSADEFLKLYPASTDDEAKLAQSQSARDQALVSMYLWAKVREKTAKTNVYEYLWDHAMPGPDAERFGAFHTSEVPYVLNTLYMSDRPFKDTDRKIAEMMSSYWANFAAKGDPNGKGVPRWRPIGDEANIMEVGDKTEAIPVAGSPAKFEFFKRYLLQ